MRNYWTGIIRIFENWLHLGPRRSFYVKSRTLILFYSRLSSGQDMAVLILYFIYDHWHNGRGPEHSTVSRMFCASYHLFTQKIKHWLL